MDWQELDLAVLEDVIAHGKICLTFGFSSDIFSRLYYEGLQYKLLFGMYFSFCRPLSSLLLQPRERAWTSIAYQRLDPVIPRDIKPRERGIGGAQLCKILDPANWRTRQEEKRPILPLCLTKVITTYLGILCMLLILYKAQGH